MKPGIKITLTFLSLIQPKGIMRQVEIVLCVVAFGIVGHGGPTFHSYWNWCMFTWFFCALMTLVIVIIEMLGLHLLLRLCMNWDDFTTGMAMLSSLMVFSASIIYPVFYACKSCILAIVATAVSFLCFVVYTNEAVLAKHSGGGGYLSTVPGFLKVLEAFVACIIFISLTGYFGKLGMEWCVVVYAVCFPVTVVIIVLNVLPILKLLPFPFDKVMAGFHVLAVLLYLSAAILWPYYSSRKNPRPADCQNCVWDNLLVVTVMTYVNLTLYIVDLIYSMCGFLIH